MKRVLAILLFVPFVMTLALPCHAAGNGEVTVSLPIVFIGAGLFWFHQKNRRGGPKG